MGQDSKIDSALFGASRHETTLTPRLACGGRENAGNEVTRALTNAAFS